MKYFCCFTLLILLSTIPVLGQENLDNTWVFGQFWPSGNPLLEGSILDFSQEEVEISSFDCPIDMDFTNASICDAEGNLLFYTNGRFVMNAEHGFMENGDSLNGVDIIFNFSMRSVQGAFILPAPGINSRYFIFHSGLRSYTVDEELHITSGAFYYSEVDFNNSNFPLGYVSNKNNLIIDDTLNYGKLTATKHANGRDWWILTSKWKNNKIYRYLLSPQGVIEKDFLDAGGIMKEGTGQAVFSPDGTKYVHSSLAGVDEVYLSIFDFNRCDGILSNRNDNYFIEQMSTLGVAFSSDSRYLYLVKTTEIVQFDTEAEDIWSSAVVVAEYDGFEAEILTESQDTLYVPTRFFMAQLGPDGKIYINSPNHVPYLHVINEPDLQGIDCDVAQHSVLMPSLNRFSLPNFPNYRLGALEGSPCDTIPPMVSTSTNLADLRVEIYPNPNDGAFTVSLGTEFESKTVFLVYNAVGEQVHEQACSASETIIRAEHLPQGLYFYEVLREGRRLGQGKVLIGE